MNLLAVLPNGDGAEVFTELLRRPGVRVEHIVSSGQLAPVDAPYDQPHDEWVLLLAGAARLWIEGAGECEIVLAAGDDLLIPAGTRHRVTWTATPTVWLALHFEP